MANVIYNLNSLSFYHGSVFFLGVFLLSCSYILILYILIYTWRNMQMTLMSYLKFFMNFIIFLLMGLSALFIIVKPIATIHLEDLSKISLYKYSVLLITCFIGIIIIILRKVLMTQYKDEASRFLSFLYFSHLKEEIRLLLYTWNDTFMGNFCIRLLNFIILKNNRIFYLITHFIVFNVLPFTQTIFLINFVFFHGELNYVLYLLPVSFFIWCLRFIEYYFNTFVTQSGFYIHAVLHVKLTSAAPENTSPLSYISCNISDLRCKLTAYGIQESFTKHDLSYLANKWLQLNHITIDFERYLKFVSYFNYLNLALRILCWSGIVYKCLISSAYICLYPLAPILGRASTYRRFHSSCVLYAHAYILHYSVLLFIFLSCDVNRYSFF